MRFEDVAQHPDPKIDLAVAALLIAADEYPDLDVDGCLERLDALAEEVGSALSETSSDFERLERLTGFLYGEFGLRGNQDDYYDPRNSYLNEVLDRRLGIPISLAVLCIEVGRRVGVPLVGVGFPGHFLVRHAVHPELVIDPFDGGRFLTEGECAEILERVGGDAIPFRRELLKPVAARQVVERMLNNLRGIYLQRRDLGKAIRVIERLMELVPGELRHRRDRGLLRLYCGDVLGAEDLESYLAHNPEDEDREDLEKLIAEAHHRLGGNN